VGTASYTERLRAPWWLWMLAVLFCASLGVAVLPVLGPVPALLGFAVTTVLAGWFLTATAAPVEVRDGDLVAGRARIPVRLLGTAVPLDPERARLLRGPDIDPGAYHLIRAWVPTAVMVDVTDPTDPTPYWYVATRQPQQLASALDAARVAG
jgi:hypothetical protein